MLSLRQIWVLLWKDLLIDLRRMENLIAMFFFAFLTLLIFNFAFGERGGVSFRYTSRVQERLVAGGVPGDVLAPLSPLLGVTHGSQQAFLHAVERLQVPLSNTQRIAVVQASRVNFIQNVAAGLFWITFLLAGLLGLDKSFSQEKEHGCMDGLLLTPVPRGLVYLGKMSSNALFLGVITVILVPLFALLFQLDLHGLWGRLALIAVGGIVGFTTLGTLLGGVTTSLRGKEVLLPLLLFPLMVPMLLVVVHLTDVVLQGGFISQNLGWLQLLAAFDAVFLVASYLAFDYVMEA